jgi:hypothetical protein
MRARTCWVLALALGLGSPLPAFAQAPERTPSDLFHLGREAFDKGDYTRALELFRESNKREPGLGKLANVARTEARLGLVGSALRHFREAVDKLPETDSLRVAIVQEIAELGPKVPYLRVSLAPAAPPGTTVTVDGALLEAAGLGREVPVDPGKHVVTAAAPGAKEKRYELTLAVAARGAVEVAPEPLAPSETKPGVGAPEVVPPGPPSSRSSSPLVGIGFGVSGAGIVAGAITGGLSWAKTSTIRANCPGHPCPSSQNDAISSANMLANASNATFAIGVAGVVVGVVGIVLSRPKAPAALRVEPVVGPGGVGVRGAF